MALFFDQVIQAAKRLYKPTSSKLSLDQNIQLSRLFAEVYVLLTRKHKKN